MNVADMVREFHEAFGLEVRGPAAPGKDWPSFPLENLREDLLDEEVAEYHEGVTTCDIVEIADALADMVYVIYGTAITYGIPLDEVLAEVHRSNMSKLGEDGKPILREDGKVLKGPGFFRPDIAGVLAARAQVWEQAAEAVRGLEAG